MDINEAEAILELPQLPDGNWDPDLHAVVLRMSEWFEAGTNLLLREDIEPIRYSVAAEGIGGVLSSPDMFIASGAPPDWVNRVITTCRILQGRLLLAADTAHPR